MDVTPAKLVVLLAWCQRPSFSVSKVRPHPPVMMPSILPWHSPNPSILPWHSPNPSILPWCSPIPPYYHGTPPSLHITMTLPYPSILPWHSPIPPYYHGTPPSLHVTMALPHPSILPWHSPIPPYYHGIPPSLHITMALPHPSILPWCSLIPPASPPLLMPRNVQANWTVDGRVIVTWQPPAPSGLPSPLSGYKLNWDTPGRASQSALRALPRSSRSSVLEDLDIRSRYTILVWAYSRGGDGPPATITLEPLVGK